MGFGATHGAAPNQPPSELPLEPAQSDWPECHIRDSSERDARLEYVPLWDIEREWPAIEPLLNRALAKQTGLSAESVKADCLRGKFWLWHVPGRVAFVTEIQQFPLERICMIVLCSGDGLDDWLSEADETLTRHAKHFGCAALTIVGRKGWSRAVPAYTLEAHVMRKAL